MFEKNLRLAMLFDLYGELLTDTQKTMFDLYYNDDLSLAEISENTGITRQGVRDSIKRGEELLLSWEEKLGLAEKLVRIEAAAEKVEPLLKSLEEKYPEDAAAFQKFSELLGACRL